MADANDPKPADTDNKLLQKILNRLGTEVVTGPLTDAQLRASAVPVSGPLTDTQLRANPVPVAGNTVSITAEFSRPGDTTAYTIGDVVGVSPAALITFSNSARIAQGSGYVVNVRLSKSAATTTNSSMRLYLYHTAPTAIVDNAPFTLLYANKAKLIGYVDLTFVTEGAGSDSAVAFVDSIRLHFNCDAAATSLFGVLVAEAAYAPANAESFYVELGIEQN